MTSTTGLAVQKTITVNAPVERAFDVFTKGMTSWWPLASHHIGAVDATEAVMEPREGGRWYEKGVDGSECNWGSVLAWEPPTRVVLAWNISADWQYDPSIDCELEVRFTALPGGGTRVDLDHRKLEAYGERANDIATAIAGEGGWTSLLAAFAAAVDG